MDTKVSEDGSERGEAEDPVDPFNGRSIATAPALPAHLRDPAPHARGSTSQLAGTHAEQPADRNAATAVLPPGAVFAVSNAHRKHPDSTPPLDFSGNRSIGRFELIREIARGGMGQVFLGRDPNLGRKVAIKFLLRDDPHFVQRCVVEARATARCTHENIVTIFEVGEHNGLPYMVLEYLEGKTLSDVLDGRPSLRQFVELIIPVVRALERAHAHGIVHRDLKPSNVFVTERGQVKVLDFGVARLIDREDAGFVQATPPTVPENLDHRPDTNQSFTSNSLIGTYPYMSPEQWGTDVVDHQSDLWAVGVMFWKALVEAHPAGTLSPEKLRVRLCDLTTPVPSIGMHDPTIPPAIVAIVDRCLAKHKQERYQSAAALLADLQAFLAPATDCSSADNSPYRGLAAFSERDAQFFFGRSGEVRTAMSRLEQWPLLAVVGPSGVGKSSFVHAGLVPAVRARDSWQVQVLRPGRAPLYRLAAVLEATLPTGEHQPDLLEKLAVAPGLFGSMLRAAAIRRRQGVLVVVDQLEELFTLCDNDDVRSSFLASLLAAADDSTSPVRVVLSMRADFLDRLAGHKQFLAELTRGLFFLTAPDRDNLRETLQRPAELAGYSFEDPAIVDDMLQVATSRGALPLLSFAASRLWDARDREQRLLTTAAYHQMGGVGGAFAQHADQVAAAVPPSSQRLLRAIMTRLVTPEGTRAVVDQSELLSLATDPAQVEAILDQLVRARLIHLQTDQDQVTTVEIVHEMLITEWPTLRRWLDDNQALRGFMHELQQAARQWAARGKPNDLVWRGATAQEALGHADRHVLDLSLVEHQFLAAVRRQVGHARRRRVLVLASIVTTLGLVLFGGAVAMVRIKHAETVAKDKARQAVDSLDEAQAARAQLQGKLDIIEAEKKARETAEAERLAEEHKRKLAEQDLEHSKELSRDQLQQANEQLQNQVREAQASREAALAARAAALAAEAAAKRATEEAQRAKHETEILLSKEKAARARLEREKQTIFDGDLRKREGSP
ncbi:MAG: protein kinase [Kofleriaceae bacterium]